MLTRRRNRLIRNKRNSRVKSSALVVLVGIATAICLIYGTFALIFSL